MRRFPTPAARWYASALALTLAGGSSGIAEARAQSIVELARQRHEHFDTALSDYRSQLKTLVSVGLVTDRLAPPQLIVASELASEVAWGRDAGLQVRMVGQRYVTALELGAEQGADFGLDFSEPWFVATTPGDSIRVLGGIEIPGRASVHPFSAGASEYYEYEIGDTITLSTPQRVLDLIEVRVTPTRGDESLVVGSLWVDESSGDIAAWQIRFVGKPLWADDENPEGSAWANRILSLSAVIEQGLWEQRYWLPRRQEVELNIDIPFFSNLALPLVFSNEFGRYDINTGQPIVWVSSDSSREGSDDSWESIEVEGVDFGRADKERERTRVRSGPHDGGWEIVRPPEDSLNAYTGWKEPLEAPSEKLKLPDAEELERRARELDPSISGRKMFVIGEVQRLSEMLRYNRVEALGIGIGFQGDLPRRPFWSVAGLVGFGVADLEPKARLGLHYDAPRSQFRIDGYSELHVTGYPLTDDRRAYGSSALRPFFLGRDDADYYRSSGAAITAGRRWGTFRGRAGLSAAYESSVERNTQIAIPGIWEDSVFQPNPPATENWYYRGDLDATWFASSNWNRPGDRAEFTAGVELGTDADSLDYVQPRIGFEIKTHLGNIAWLALGGKAGWTAGDAPAQRLWRIGGLETVKGYIYGTRRGDSYWAAQIELARRGAHLATITPVVFANFGWAGDTGDWPNGGPGGDLLWSAGPGISFLNGLFRTDLVFRESGAPWLELYFAGSL